ncbi:MAG: hypothetical protein RBR22_11740 [Desulfuromonas sp.]|jgi:Zn ribbon nucleic-acid-binding protein|nr:hypothetical protein [Desulfuromonas sp.]
MNCPACKHTRTKVQNLRGDGFTVEIVECKTCGTTWSVNHGVTEIIKDTQKSTFLQCDNENVEGYDYDFVA